jgi:hypothetical protein
MPERKISPMYALDMSESAAMPMGYGLVTPVSSRKIGPKPRPMTRMVRTAGSPRNTSVYTRAAHRATGLREMPIRASTMPTTQPMMPETIARTRVLGRPTENMAGSTSAMAFQSRKVSASLFR